MWARSASSVARVAACTACRSQACASGEWVQEMIVISWRRQQRLATRHTAPDSHTAPEPPPPTCMLPVICKTSSPSRAPGGGPSPAGSPRRAIMSSTAPVAARVALVLGGWQCGSRLFREGPVHAAATSATELIAADGKVGWSKVSQATHLAQQRRQPEQARRAGTHAHGMRGASNRRSAPAHLMLLPRLPRTAPAWSLVMSMRSRTLGGAIAASPGLSSPLLAGIKGKACW